jgi:hypothetical protein
MIISPGGAVGGLAPTSIKEKAMKWMLFILVFGSYPVETSILFDSLDA